MRAVNKGSVETSKRSMEDDRRWISSRKRLTLTDQIMRADGLQWRMGLMIDIQHVVANLCNCIMTMKTIDMTQGIDSKLVIKFYFTLHLYMIPKMAQGRAFDGF